MVRGGELITYIIGTDTDAGKTYYGKSLIKEGHRVIKPIETGKLAFNHIDDSDAYSYAKLQNLPLESVNLYFFNQPVSPHLASELDEIVIDIDKVKFFIETHRDCFIELAGGLMVPINREYTQLDLIKETRGQVDLVIGNKLGCINHALLTISILIKERIPIRKVIINDFGLKENFMMADNRRFIESFLNLHGYNMT